LEGAASWFRHIAWSWVLAVVVAVPAAQSGNDQRERRASVVDRGSSGVQSCLELLRETEEGGSESVVDEIAGRTRAAVSGVDQLAGAQRGDHGHGGEVEHALRRGDLAVLEGKPVALEGAEGLLDAPAQA